LTDAMPRLRTVLHPSLLAALAMAVAAAVPATARERAADVTGPQIVSYLNAQRAANGIPAGVAEDPSRSAGCADHDRYGAANAVLEHREDPAKPGYTEAGNATAGVSVLYRGSTWTADANPFETAPIHLHQLLSPYLDRVGAFETGGYGCATTLASTARPPEAVDTLFVYPGDGTRGWRTSEIDQEGPYTPGQTVGIAAGTRTGPTLYVLTSGPGLRWATPAQVVSASLRGPAGPVELVTFDRSSPLVGQYLPSGAQLLPKAPLAPATMYTASVALRVTPDAGGPRDIARTWSFTTTSDVAGPVAAPTGADATQASACVVGLRARGVRRLAGQRRLRLETTVCHAATMQVLLRRGARTVLRRDVRLANAGTRTVGVTLPHGLRPGRYTLRVTLGGAVLSSVVTVPAAR
jgi:hypothetical protein